MDCFLNTLKKVKGMGGSQQQVSFALGICPEDAVVSTFIICCFGLRLLILSQCQFRAFTAILQFKSQKRLSGRPTPCLAKGRGQYRELGGVGSGIWRLETTKVKQLNVMEHRWKPEF